MNEDKVTETNEETHGAIKKKKDNHTKEKMGNKSP